MTKKKPNDSERRETITVTDLIAEVCDRLKDTLQRKNADYGCSASRSPLLCPELPAHTAILVRMSDKINRILTLEQWNGVAERVDEMFLKTEPLADTYLDLAGYAILRIIDLEKNQ